MKEQKYPKSFSHIGITVPDIKKAVEFYSEVMGWYIIMPPSTVKKESDTAIGQMCIDVFGDDWEYFEIAHMSTSDGIGIVFIREVAKSWIIQDEIYVFIITICHRTFTRIVRSLNDIQYSTIFFISYLPITLF